MKTEKSKFKYIMYLRKSTDLEDRQVQSIEDQENELNKLVRQLDLNVVKIVRESGSAKKLGRIGFNEMLGTISEGKANAILAWKINRLSRNPVDGGQIQWLLQNKVIECITTPSKDYLPSDNIIMMAVELGMANQFSIDLSRDVARGMKSKVVKGWRPMRACIGYLNDRAGLKGEKKIFTDPERFPLVRQMWDWLLSGQYSVPKLIKKANEELGLRNRDGNKVGVSAGYKLFTNSFYYGEFEYNGEWFVGKHQPMITKQEYDLAQKILGRLGKPRLTHKRLPFTGVIKCGECGGMITAEEKYKYIKSLKVTKQLIYNRCSKRKKGVECHQKPIKFEELSKQVTDYLDSITIPKEFLGWALEVLKDNNQLEESNRTLMLANHRNNQDACLRRIDNLINMYVCPSNAMRELLTEDEYKAQKSHLMAEKAEIEAEIRKLEQNVDQWLELTEKTFEFATYAKHWFEKGDFEQKTQILGALGQNFVFNNGKLHIDLQKPFLTLKQGLEAEPLRSARLEPSTYAVDKTKSTPLGGAYSRWSG